LTLTDLACRVSPPNWLNPTHPGGVFFISSERECEQKKETLSGIQIMTDWTAGYVADIGYTYGYYTELNPLRLQLAFLNAGLVPPTVGTACELGFGQGLSANMHAAASVVQWSGTDFNPAQAAFAQELATAAGSGARLFDDAFADFCARADLPDFDFIGLHGIWSWISDDNRAVIVDFVRRKLKVGGVLYISYNTLPGWASFAPMRHFMTQHAAVMGADGQGLVNKIDASLGFAEQLLATQPLYVKANATVAERLKSVKGHPREYLAHEYFNADWHPMYFADMAKWLSPAKLGFACSANLLDHVEALNLSAVQQSLLKEIPDPTFRQTTRDFMVNQQFRKDYWVKGRRKLSTLEQAERLKTLRIVLTTHRPDVGMKVHGGLGEAALGEAVYVPVLDALAAHQVCTLGELAQTLVDKGVAFAQLLQAVVVLAGAGHLALAQDEPSISAAHATARALNNHVLKQARSGQEMGYLSSPVTGAAISVNRFCQLFLLAQKEGKSTPEEWAEFVWGILSKQGQRLVKDGKTLDAAEDNLAELTQQAQTFSVKQMPILKALQVF
jgi:SAM-dependent methyltransferase